VLLKESQEKTFAVFSWLFVGEWIKRFWRV